MTSKPIFILGAQRSGTTLLRLLINNHPEIAIPPESHFLDPILKQYRGNSTLDSKARERLFSNIVTHPRFKTWNLPQQRAREIIFDEAHVTLPEVISALFEEQIAPTGKRRWGDKTPEYTFHAQRLSELFKESSIIFIVRDGRDVSDSMLRKGWIGFSEFERAFYWKRTCRICRRMEQILGAGRFMRLSYEDLVCNTRGTLEEVCRFIGEAFSEKMLAYPEDYEKHIAAFEMDNGIHEKFSRLPDPQVDIQKWRLNKPPLRTFSFELVAWRELLVNGYDLAYPSICNPAFRILEVLHYGYGFLMKFIYHIVHWTRPRGLKVWMARQGWYVFLKRKLQGWV